MFNRHCITFSFHISHVKHAEATYHPQSMQSFRGCILSKFLAQIQYGWLAWLVCLPGCMSLYTSLGTCTVPHPSQFDRGEGEVHQLCVVHRAQEVQQITTIARIKTFWLIPGELHWRNLWYPWNSYEAIEFAIMRRSHISLPYDKKVKFQKTSQSHTFL